MSQGDPSTPPSIPSVPPPLPSAGAPSAVAYAPPPQERSSGLPIAGFVLSLCGLVPYIGLVLALIGVILSTVAMRRRGPGRGFAIAGLVVGLVLFVVWAAFIGAIVWAAVFFTRTFATGWPTGLPGPGSMGGPTSACEVNLWAVGQSIQAHERATGGLPPDLDTLVRGGYLTPYQVACPVSSGAFVPGGPAVGYFYLPPARRGPRDALIACDFAGNHSDGSRCVLRADYAAETLSSADFATELGLPRNAAFAAALATAEAASVPAPATAPATGPGSGGRLWERIAPPAPDTAPAP